MKSTQTTFTILILIFSINIHAQTTYIWNGGDGAYANETNWTPQGIPMGSNNIVFDNTGDILVYGLPETLTSIGDVSIINGSNVTLESNAVPSGLDISCNNLLIDETSSLIIEQSNKYIHLSFYSGEVDGLIYLNNNEHKILIDEASTFFLNFNNGSSFIAGNALVGYPFGDSGISNINFNDESNYYHFGGNSPFGSSSVDITNFSPESNYYIINNGSVVQFSNKTYGNIYIGQAGETYVDVTVNTMSTGTNAFSFNTITTENGSLIFEGSGTDNVKIFGGINAASGNIELKAGTFKFIGDCYIYSDNTSPHEIKLTCYKDSDFAILSPNDSLTLESKLTIESGVNLLVDGTIDFTINQFYTIGTGGSLEFSNSAKLITANPNGFTGSINGGNYSFSPETSFELNGIETQNINLPEGNDVGKIIINNPSDVNMDKSITIDSLFLENGYLNINNLNLTIKKHIEYFNGKLLGSVSSNLRLIDEVEEFLLNQDLTLNNLLINGTNANIILEDGILTTINNIIINNGTLDLNNNELKVNNNLNLNGGKLLINNGNLIINNTINFSGGDIFGDQNAKLTFLSNAKEITSLPSLELSEFYLEAPVQITLGGDLTIYDLITLNSGSLLISETGENYELKLLGDFQSGGGILEGTNGSNLSIEGTNEGNINLIFSNTNNTLNTLSINRPSSIIDFSSDLIIEENLDLSDGKIRFNNSILSLAENSIVSNFSENSYIITGENGIVKKVINANEDFEFPIGTNLYYAPVNITPQNTETFTIRVTDNILQNGYTGSPITDQRIVNLTWNIEHPNNTIVFDSNFSWEIGAERSDFNQSLSYLATYNTLNNKWVKITESNTDVNSINNLFAPEIKVQGLFSISSIFNTPPSAEDQEFTIQEHSLNETVVGNLVASDSDIGQILTFYLQENTINPDAFIFHEDGTISVKNSDLLEYSLHPTFNYTVDVCDNGEPEIECSNFDVTINLTEVTQNFLVTNYISPNGDGKNDTWVIKGLEKETYSVAILDGKGNIIFRSDDYKNTWDGTKFGNKLAPGVYYYSITSKNVSQKGTITLIR